MNAGQCASCRQARRVSTRRGSSFLLCERSRSDETFVRYPALPVRHCPGYEPIETGSGSDEA